MLIQSTYIYTMILQQQHNMLIFQDFTANTWQASVIIKFSTVPPANFFNPLESQLGEIFCKHFTTLPEAIFGDSVYACLRSYKSDRKAGQVEKDSGDHDPFLTA